MEYPHAYIKQLVFSFSKYDALYFRVPKVASTSLLMTFRQIDEVKEAENYKRYRSYDSYFKFAFVRNPFDRLASCFRHVIQKGALRGIQGHPQLHRDMPFDQFVDVIRTIPTDKMDIHFRPQHTFLAAKMDHIGKFENIQEDYPIVCKKIGIKNALPLLHENKTDKTRFKDYYDEEIMAKVAKLYRMDFELFGYDKEKSL